MFLTTAGVNPLFGPITWSLPSEDLEQGKKFLEHFYRVRLGAHEIESFTRKIYQTRKIRLITIKHTLRIRIRLLEREVRKSKNKLNRLKIKRQHLFSHPQNRPFAMRFTTLLQHYVVKDWADHKQTLDNKASMLMYKYLRRSDIAASPTEMFVSQRVNRWESISILFATNSHVLSQLDTARCLIDSCSNHSII